MNFFKFFLFSFFLSVAIQDIFAYSPKTKKRPVDPQHHKPRIHRSLQQKPRVGKDTRSKSTTALDPHGAAKKTLTPTSTPNMTRKDLQVEKQPRVSFFQYTVIAPFFFIVGNFIYYNIIKGKFGVIKKNVVSFLVAIGVSFLFEFMDIPLFTSLPAKSSFVMYCQSRQIIFLITALRLWSFAFWLVYFYPSFLNLFCVLIIFGILFSIFPNLSYYCFYYFSLIYPFMLCISIRTVRVLRSTVRGMWAEFCFKLEADPDYRPKCVKIVKYIPNEGGVNIYMMVLDFFELPDVLSLKKVVSSEPAQQEMLSLKYVQKEEVLSSKDPQEEEKVLSSKDPQEEEKVLSSKPAQEEETKG